MAWGPASGRTAPLPSNWPALRAAVRERDGGRCVGLDGTPCGSTDRVQVDHMGEAWDHRMEMLRCLCHRCHASRTAQQAATVRHRYRERRPAERHPGAS